MDNMPTANIRRKTSIAKMAITINGGPVGKGICIQHPTCVVDGIHMLKGTTRAIKKSESTTGLTKNYYQNVIVTVEFIRLYTQI